MFNFSVQCAVADAQFGSCKPSVSSVSAECLLYGLPAQVTEVQVVCVCASGFRCLIGYFLCLSEVWLYLPVLVWGVDICYVCRRAVVSDVPCLVKLLAQGVQVSPEVGNISTELVEYLVEYLSLALERVLPRLVHHGKLHALRVLRYVLAEHLCVNFPFLAQHRHLLGDVFQLPDVSWPLVS